MPKAEELKCPACGASKVSRISGKDYQCDYCGSMFLVKNADYEAPQPEIRATFVADTYVDPQPVVNAVVKKTSGCVLIVLITILVVVLGFVIWVSNTAKTASAADAAVESPPTLDSYDCLAGSKGAAVWLILKSSIGPSDHKYFLRVMNPMTKKIIAERVLSQTVIDLYFSDAFFAINDTVYSTVLGGGRIMGLDLYTGKTILRNDYFENKFPVLKKIGIREAELQLAERRIKITLASGSHHYYYFDSKQLISEKEVEAKNAKEVFEKNIFLSYNEGAELYLCNKRKEPGETYYIEDRFTSILNFKPPSIKSVVRISETTFPQGVPIAKYKDQLLFAYAEDFPKKSPGILALVNKHGQIIWENKDALFTSLPLESVPIKYTLEKDLIIIRFFSISAQKDVSTGIDLKTGKILFVYEYGTIS